MNTQTNNERVTQLITDCLANKRKAQHQFFKLFYSRAMSVCMRYAKDEDEAADMLNEGFMKVFSNLAKYTETEKGSFDAWFKKVMIHTAIDYQRRYKKLTQTVDYEDIPAVEIQLTNENEAIAKLSADELIRHIQLLPPTTRQVFNLYVFEDLPHAEIAKLLDMKEGTSQWHLNQARTKLKEIITKNDQ